MQFRRRSFAAWEPAATARWSARALSRALRSCWCNYAGAARGAHTPSGSRQLRHCKARLAGRGPHGGRCGYTLAISQALIRRVGAGSYGTVERSRAQQGAAGAAVMLVQLRRRRRRRAYAEWESAATALLCARALSRARTARRALRIHSCKVAIMPASIPRVGAGSYGTVERSRA